MGLYDTVTRDLGTVSFLRAGVVGLGWYRVREATSVREPRATDQFSQHRVPSHLAYFEGQQSTGTIPSE